MNFLTLKRSTVPGKELVARVLLDEVYFLFKEKWLKKKKEANITSESQTQNASESIGT